MQPAEGWCVRACMGARIAWVAAALVMAVVLVAAPDAARADEEVARVEAHLRRALDRLNARDVSHLDAGTRARRRASIAALGRYIARAEFPRRTADGHRGLRPRFIDDRGVHCAVGQLIADSGLAGLARAIDARHEYAYVPELRSPLVAAWAGHHGFTLDELAMIQPEYHEPPPSPERTREVLERIKERLALRCARRAPWRSEVVLRVSGDKRGRFQAVTTTPGEFAGCVAAMVRDASQEEPGRHDPYTFTMTLRMPEPQALLDREMPYLRVPVECSPRPGALSREAMIDVRSDREGLAIRVTTTPANLEVEACIEAETAYRLREFDAGVWSLRARTAAALPVAPRFSDRSLATALELAADTYATRCYPADAAAAPAETTVTVTTRVDDPHANVTVAGGDAAFQACVRTWMLDYLRRTHQVTREVGGKHQSYFRVDAAARARVTVPVKPPDR